MSPIRIAAIVIASAAGGAFLSRRRAKRTASGEDRTSSIFDHLDFREEEIEEGPTVEDTRTPAQKMMDYISGGGPFGS